jgi:membrane protease YdiL (CAAX protease family)
VQDTTIANAFVTGAIAMYVVYAAFAGAQDYKKLVAGERLWFYRKWSAELGLLTLGGAAALLATGRIGDVTTFPSALGPLHDFLIQPIAAFIFWLLFTAFCALMAAPLVSVARLAPNEANAKRATKTLAATPMVARDARERAWGTILSILAGAGEELVFRLALPVALFALTHNLPAALIISVVGFGIGHVYQGLSGVILTGATGALMLGVYAATQSLWLVAIFHALVDYRAIVVLGRMLERLARSGGASP